jgi:hypothetical protein
MADLRTRYLGMELRSPLVASSSPLTGTLDGLRRLEAAGAGAVVLPSLFEEDLAEAGPAAGAEPGGQAGYGAGPGAYLSLVSQARAALSIPVVASLNGVSRGGWASSASRLEEAGASALELNSYYVSSRPGLSGSDVEWHYLDVVRAVRRAIGIPLAVKLSPYFSSLTNMAGLPVGGRCREMTVVVTPAARGTLGRAGTRSGVRAEVTWAQRTSGPAGRRERRPDPGRTSRPRGRRRHALAGHGRPTPVYPYGRRVPGPDRQWRLRRLGRHRAQYRAHAPPNQPLAAHVAKPYLSATLRGGPAGQRGRPCRSASTDLAIRRCRVSSVLAPVT